MAHMAHARIIPAQDRRCKSKVNCTHSDATKQHGSSSSALASLRILMTAVTSSTTHNSLIDEHDSRMIVSCKDQGYSAILDSLLTVNITALDFTSNMLNAFTD